MSNKMIQNINKDLKEAEAELTECLSAFTSFKLKVYDTYKSINEGGYYSMGWVSEMNDSYNALNEAYCRYSILSEVAENLKKGKSGDTSDTSTNYLNILSGIATNIRRMQNALNTNNFQFESWVMPDTGKNVSRLHNTVITDEIKDKYYTK